MTEGEVEALKGRIKELEKEIAKLEKWIADLQEQALRRLKPSDIVAGVERQQIESLTYHLMKERQRSLNFEEQVNKLNRKVNEKDDEITQIRYDTEKVVVETKKPATEGQSFDLGEIIPEDELDGLFHADDKPLKRKPPATDVLMYVKLLAKHKIFTISDAAILMGADRDRVKKITDDLRKKKLVKGGQTMESHVHATKKLLKLASKL